MILLLTYPLSLCFFHLVFSSVILLCHFRLVRSGFSLLSSASVLAGDSWRLSDQISHLHCGVQRQLWWWYEHVLPDLGDNYYCCPAHLRWWINQVRKCMYYYCLGKQVESFFCKIVHSKASLVFHTMSFQDIGEYQLFCPQKMVWNPNPKTQQTEPIYSKPRYQNFPNTIKYPKTPGRKRKWGTSRCGP